MKVGVYLGFKEEAFKRFVDLYFMKKTNKLDSLSDWIQFYSNELIEEANGNRQDIYNVYKQGSIVLVRLGINIGSEMSKNHFCIVLNKNDTSRSSKLTVVPMSSKEQADYLKIDNEYLISLASYTKSIATDLQEEASRLTSLSKEITQIAKSLEIDIAAGKIPSIRQKSEEIQIKDRILIEQQQVVLEKKAIVEDVLHRLKDNRSSYVCYKDITTISKTRILEKQGNKHYPKVVLPETTLNKIKSSLLDFL